MKFKLVAIYLSAMMIFMIACENNQQKGDDMSKKIAQFAPTIIKYDESILNDRQKEVVENLYYASKIMDELFFEQVYSKNDKIKSQLLNDDSEESQKNLEYFEIMYGPFDRLEHNEPFMGNEKKPLGANFYPEDITKQEFEMWLKNHPEDEEAFTSEFTMIRREGKQLVAIPYSEFYKEKLEKAMGYLKKAAKFADNPSLKKYLLTRAAAFKSNDYYESDMAWMDLKDHTIEIVIGPYEVYEDEMFNYKAAFESFLTIVDPEESKRLAIFANYLVDIEKHLPIPDAYKNFDRGSESPIVVVQEIFAGGDNKAGVQTLAFNLPNDERVREAKGSKKVMLKNLHEAKFEKLLNPIAKIVLAEDQLQNVTFNSFFKHTLMHEMSHGVGPGNITINGRETDVKKELKETYSSLEECKADVLGMYNNIFMIEKGVFPKSFENETYVTFLAGIFRTIRFGISEAHGAGSAIIYNYLLEQDAYQYNATNRRVRVNSEKIYNALEELATKILTIQAEGDYEGAKALIANYAILSPSMEALRLKLSDLPVDIKPVFQIEKSFEDIK